MKKTISIKKVMKQHKQLMEEMTMKEKIKIEIKRTYDDLVLFSFESYDNTIKKTVLEAIRHNTDLSSADLSSADLSSADLSSADLNYANLRYANLRYANLRYANLSSADLRYADLSSADLSSADLRYANLRYANLSSADLRYANLSSADLRYADLSSANLRYANLRYANLRYANLSSADLNSADVLLLKHLYQIIPEEGSFIAWKKANGYVLKLEIHKSAKRTCNIKSRKCRSSKVRTLEIQNIDGTKSGITKCVGDYDGTTLYEVNRVTRSDKYDDNFFQDCTNGIHFFITRHEAANYQ